MVLRLLGQSLARADHDRREQPHATQTNRRGRRRFPRNARVARDQCALLKASLKNGRSQPRITIGRSSFNPTGTMRSYLPALAVALALGTLGRPAAAFERQWHLGGGIG